MIAFSHGNDPDDPPDLSKEKYLELLKAILQTDPFYIGSYHGNLSPQQLGDILANVMYAQNYQSINVSIEKEADGYHLGLTIDKKSK
tara:strand:+ start:233 stop:493 length:261 start_codon:yes stop_codon:yes gene_type:complete